MYESPSSLLSFTTEPAGPVVTRPANAIASDWQYTRLSASAQMEIVKKMKIFLGALHFFLALPLAYAIVWVQS